MKIIFDQNQCAFSGPAGALNIRDDDEVGRRFAMLVEGQCEGRTVTEAAHLFGMSRQRYYQLLHDYSAEGFWGLFPDTPGPKTNYRRTDEVVRLVIRNRFLDPDAPPEVIAQLLRQKGHAIAQRSVQRIIADFGLQKKLYALNPANPPQYVPTQRTPQPASPGPGRSPEPGAASAPIAGRQNLRQSGGHLVPGPGAFAAGHLGFAPALDRTIGRPGGAPPGPGSGQRSGDGPLLLSV
jgi:hypothetical protein